MLYLTLSSFSVWILFSKDQQLMKFTSVKYSSYGWLATHLVSSYSEYLHELCE